MSTKEWAIEVTGGLSKTTKMPGYSYSLPAQACLTGSILRKIPGSVCSACYARKGFYQFPSAVKALSKRLESLSHPQWVDAMVYLLTHQKSEWFRWHDSGDLQSLDHLRKIFDVSEQTPYLKHWLPTKEWSMLAEYFKNGGAVPSNVTIRLSHPMISTMKVLPKVLSDFPVSTVGSASDFRDAFHCQGVVTGKCGECRACWDSSVRQVHYAKH